MGKKITNKHAKFYQVWHSLITDNIKSCTIAFSEAVENQFYIIFLLILTILQETSVQSLANYQIIPL